MENKIKYPLIGLATAGVAFGIVMWRKYNRLPLPVVEKVDLDRYMGLWYEIARLPMRHEKECYGSTANYSKNPDGTVKVINSCRRGSLDGEETKSEGKAWVVDHASQAILKVQFQWPFTGDYYIIDLGKEYNYALVGSPSRKYLWILSRSPEMDPDIKERLVMFAKELGFRTEKLIYTIHHAGQTLDAVETFRE